MIYKATRRVALLEKELVTLPIHVQPRFLVSCTRSCFSKPRWTVAFYCTEAGRHQVWTEKGRHPPPPQKNCKKSTSDRQLLTSTCYYTHLHNLVSNVYNGFIRRFDTPILPPMRPCQPLHLIIQSITETVGKTTSISQYIRFKYSVLYVQFGSIFVTILYLSY